MAAGETVVAALAVGAGRPSVRAMTAGVTVEPAVGVAADEAVGHAQQAAPVEDDDREDGAGLDHDGVGVGRDLGPQCADHETLRTNDATFTRAIVTGDGTRHAFPDVLARWLARAGRTSVVESYDPAGPPRSCYARR